MFRLVEHPRLEQFSQRIVVYYHLEPLDRAESENYIKHRLKIAGNKNGGIFTPEAIEEIYKYSNGVPRLINLACHNSLITGLVYDSKQITKPIVLETIEELIHNKRISPFEMLNDKFVKQVGGFEISDN